MRTLLALLVLSAAAFGQYPPGVPVKVSEYVLVDGRRIAIAEWSTLLAAVPCEVQGNVKAAPCEKCKDGCKCVGGCPCHAADVAAKAAKVERPRQIDPPIPVPAIVLPPADTPLWIDWANGTRTLGTIGQYLHAGGDPMKIRAGTAATSPGYFRPYQPMPAAVPPAPTIELKPFPPDPVVTYPFYAGGSGFGRFGQIGSGWSYQIPPVRYQPGESLQSFPDRFGFGAGFKMNGPFGGGFGADACIGGR